jgi:transposase-like protein
MSQETRQKKRSKAEQIEAVVRLLNNGKTQAQAAEAIGVNIRTVQRWVAQFEVKERLTATQKEIKVIAQSDPVVLSVVDIRSQVQEILDYRDSQQCFAVEMGAVIQKATVILAKAVERIEQNPEEVNARTLPQLLRAVCGAAETVSNAWLRATGLDDLLEQVGNEPKTIESRQEED